MAQMMSLTRSEFRQSIVEWLGASVDETCARARPLLPHLSERALLLRLRFLLGASGYCRAGALDRGPVRRARRRCRVV